MKIEKLAWLAGLWDGEGSITVWRDERANGKERFNPSLVLTNTNPAIISEAAKILDELEIRMHLFKVSHDNEKHKDAYQLSTRKIQLVKKFCEAMMPYLIGKKPQAELTLRFVNSRLITLNKSSGWGHNTPYSEEEISLCDQLMRLNRRGKSKPSEAICLTQ